jgi:hypothetical protein
MEGLTITVGFEDAVQDSQTKQPILGVFDFIDHFINQQFGRIVIYIPNFAKQKEVEEWLIDHHKPCLIYISIKSVVVTNIVPDSLAIISPSSVRFTDWKDMERYFCGYRTERVSREKAEDTDTE